MTMPIPVVAAVLMALLLAIAGPSAGESLQEVRVQTIPFDAGSEAFYALDEGIFARHGLAVRVQPVGNGPAIAAAVASGAVDIGFSNALSIETAYQRGVPFVFIAPAAIYSSASPTSVLMVPKDSTLRTARDLNGKTIAVNGLRNIAEYAPAMWIDKNGGDSSSVKFVEIPPPALPAALAQHRVDAALVSEPQIAEAKKSSRVFADVFDAIGDGFMIAGYFATRRWADEHRALVREFAAAMRETATWANANPQRSAAILAKYTRLQPELVRASIRARFGEELSPAAIQPTVDLGEHYKLFKGLRPSDLIYRPD